MQSRPGVARRSHPAESLTRSQTAQRVTTWRQRYDGHSMFDLKGDWARKGRVGSIDDIYLWTQHIAEAARHSETRTVRDRSRAAGAVVVVARGVAFTLMVDGGHLLLDGSRGRRSAVDLGSLVRDERRDLECAVKVATDLDLDRINRRGETSKQARGKTSASIRAGSKIALELHLSQITATGTSNGRLTLPSL